MENLIKIIIFLSLFFPQISYSQELKICEAGVNKCEPLLHNDVKYSKCMRLMCFKYYSPQAKKDRNDKNYSFKYVAIEDDSKKTPGEEQYTPCEYGLRKCQVLQYNMQYFAECVNDSCKSPDPTARPDCEAGRSTCTDEADMLNDCMKLTCGDTGATFETCPKAQSVCQTNSRVYWQCMYKICLGPVDNYLNPPSTKKYMIVKDNNGRKRKIRIDKPEPVNTSMPGWAAKAPVGVDPEEWTHSMPQKFMIIGNPSDNMKCIMPAAIIQCKTSDLRSCTCSDGTYPVMLKGTPSLRYGEP